MRRSFRVGALVALALTGNLIQAAQPNATAAIQVAPLYFDDKVIMGFNCVDARWCQHPADTSGRSGTGPHLFLYR